MFALGVKMADKGHLSGSAHPKAAQENIHNLLSLAVGDAPIPMVGRRSGVGARVYVMYGAGVSVAFALVLEDVAGSWSERVELTLVAVLPEWQGQGLGRLLLGRLVRFLPARCIYARCRPASVAMKHLLEQAGFEQVAQGGGAVTYEIDKSKRGV